MRDKARREFLRMAGRVTGLALSGRLVAGAYPVQAQDALREVRIINTGGNSNLVLQDLVTAQGFMAGQGLQAVHTNAADGAKVTEALLAGTSDICMMAGFGPVLPAIEGGSTMKIVAGANLLAPQAVFSARPEIRTVKDLDGKTVGTGALGAALHQKMVALLRQKGVDEKRVVFVNVGSTTDVFKAVVAGKVDAGPADIDVYAEQERFGVHSLTDGDMWSEMPLFTNQASYASERAIAEKREILVRALAAYALLYRFLCSPQSRDAFVDTYLGKFKSAKPAAPLSQWSFYQKHRPYAVDLVIAEDKVRYIQELNVGMGLQRRVLPFDQVADMSLARDALKLIGAA